MTSFTTRAASSSVVQPDPAKHVNFSLGMVLGVDDFKQEFAYLTGRDQWLARDLLGYGTAEGLRVTTDYEDESQGTVEVVVTPGAALSPRGQLIRVAPTQCADLNGWLGQEANRKRVDSLLGAAASGTLPLYVVLSFRDCATDSVPIPGEPCRSEEESMAASRLADNFRLELKLDAPDQREEDALRDFVRWLEQVRITHEAGGDGFVTLKNFETAVRRAMQGGSPPASMRVQTADACEYLRAAFRIWVTELRPEWLGQGASAAGATPTEEGVLLAELRVPVVKESGGWVVAARAVREVEVHEERRPYLLHLRMVQEWIECGRKVRSPSDSVMAEISFGQSPSPGTREDYSRADHTHGTPPLKGDVTDSNAGRTVVERIRNVPVIYDRERAADGQVLTYFLEGEDSRRLADEKVDREEALADLPETAHWRPSDLLLQGVSVAKAQDAGLPEAGQVLTYVSGARGEEGVWQAASPAAAAGTPKGLEGTLQGDVTGPTDNTIVERLRGTEIAELSEEKFAPQNNQVLTFVVDGDTKFGRWVAADPQSQAPPDLTLEGDVVGSTTTGTTVRRISGTEVADLTAAPLRPQAGQVLTFLSPGGGAPARWQAATPSVNGDVQGPSSNNTLTNIKGMPIVVRSGGPPFVNGDVLTFNGDRWLPMPAAAGTTPSLDGDVTGAITNNEVRRLRGFDIQVRQTTPPTLGTPFFNEGDVLMFRDGRWVPETMGGKEGAGSFVERPAGQPPYAIVAAGIVSDNASRGPVYNDLNLRVVGNGIVTVGFTGYRPPDDTFQYIVKALPVFNAELRLGNVAVMFDSFLKTDDLGFRLRVTNDGQPLEGEQLRLLELMIEVSRYEMLPKE